jgi:hypothetical protein
MKRKDLYEYVRESIINELTVTPVTSANAADVKRKISSSSGLTSTQKTDLTKSATPGSTINLPESELEEMARKANNLKVGSQEKFEAAKDLYEGGWIANLLNFIAEAGEDGISQKDLAEKLGKKDSANINPAIQELKMVKAIATTRIKGDTSPEVTDSEEEDVIAVAGDEEEEEEDTFYKVDKEFDSSEAEEEEDKKAYANIPKLTPTQSKKDDEKIKAVKDAVVIVKKKVDRIKEMEKKNPKNYKNTNEYITKMEELKQFIQKNRNILTKAGTIKNLTDDIIS